MERLKCPKCNKETLSFFADASVRLNLYKEPNGKIIARGPQISTIFDEVRGIDCLECGMEVNSDRVQKGSECLEEIFEKVEIEDED